MKNRGIYRTVGSGKVTQANMRLSGVDGGSTASGGAFVDFGYKYQSDFSAGVDGWLDGGGAGVTLTGNIDGIGGKDDCLRITCSNVSGSHNFYKANTFSIGKLTKVTFSIYIPSTNSNVTGISLDIGYWGKGSQVLTPVADTWTTYTIYTYPTYTNNFSRLWNGTTYTFQDAGGDDVIYIKDYKIEECPLTSYLGHLLKITDSAGKSIIGYTKSAMAGESLDTEIATGTLTALKLYKITATEVNHFGTGKVVGSYFTSAGTETCDANNKVQQVLIGATTGVTIVAQDRTQYNWFNKNSAFNWNDASGYTYQIIQENGKHIYSSAITSGTLHLDASNTAMFFHDSIDFSSYAGTDAGSTPYLIAFYDSSGYMASAYAGAVGGGEGLGGEILDGWTNNGSFPYETFTAGAGSDITQAVNSSGYGIATKQCTATANALYKIVATITKASGENPRFKWGTNTGLDPSGSNSTSIIAASLTTTTGTYNTASAAYTYVGFIDATNTDFAASGLSLKKLTDVPTTGLHLMTTKNGTTRGMATKASSFNPNTITKVKIYRAY